jgi:16S rRNA (cytosine967-C5)-methyltransferase
VLEAYAQIETGVPADRALAGVFRRARDLGARERAEVSDTVYALIRGERRIEDRLARAIKAEKKKIDLIEKPILMRMRVLAHLALEGRPTDQIEALDPYAFARVPHAIQRIAEGRLPDVSRSPASEMAIDLSLPDWIATRLVARFGEQRTMEIGRALLLRAPVTLRTNTLRGSREEMKATIERDLGVTAEPTARSPLGLILPHHVDLTTWEAFKQGAIEPQDEGSQLIGLATGAAPGQTVLDACAGAGGKTLQLAAMMGNKGRLIALDPDAKKLEELKRRARRAGITNTETVEGELETLPKRLIGHCDRVLVDAPCTGTGALRRHPDAKKRLEESQLQSFVDRQRRILTAAIGALNPEGLLVYATCSVLFEENEAIADSVLATDPRIEASWLGDTLGAELAAGVGARSYAVRVGPGPSERDPDGFFIALLRRRN